MKRTYEMPMACVLPLLAEDILTASASVSGNDNIFSLPSLNGWPGQP